MISLMRGSVIQLKLSSSQRCIWIILGYFFRGSLGGGIYAFGVTRVSARFAQLHVMVSQAVYFFGGEQACGYTNSRIRIFRNEL